MWRRCNAWCLVLWGRGAYLRQNDVRTCDVTSSMVASKFKKWQQSWHVDNLSSASNEAPMVQGCVESPDVASMSFHVHWLWKYGPNYEYTWYSKYVNITLLYNKSSMQILIALVPNFHCICVAWLTYVFSFVCTLFCCFVLRFCSLTQRCNSLNILNCYIHTVVYYVCQSLQT